MKILSDGSQLYSHNMHILSLLNINQQCTLLYNVVVFVFFIRTARNVLEKCIFKFKSELLLNMLILVSRENQICIQ